MRMGKIDPDVRIEPCFLPPTSRSFAGLDADLSRRQDQALHRRDRPRHRKPRPITA